MIKVFIAKPRVVVWSLKDHAPPPSSPLHTPPPPSSDSPLSSSPHFPSPLPASPHPPPLPPSPPFRPGFRLRPPAVSRYVFRSFLTSRQDTTNRGNRSITYPHHAISSITSKFRQGLRHATTATPVLNRVSSATASETTGPMA